VAAVDSIRFDAAAVESADDETADDESADDESAAVSRNRSPTAVDSRS
jgi:hypothetical protein